MTSLKSLYLIEKSTLVHWYKSSSPQNGNPYRKPTPVNKNNTDSTVMATTCAAIKGSVRADSVGMTRSCACAATSIVSSSHSSLRAISFDKSLSKVNHSDQSGSIRLTIHSPVSTCTTSALMPRRSNDCSKASSRATSCVFRMRGSRQSTRYTCPPTQMHAPKI